MNYEEQLKQTNETNHFMIHNNIKAAMLTKDQARVTAAVTPVSLNAMESVHGGLMFIMAEIAARPADEKRRPPPCNGEQFLPVPEGDEPG